MQEEFRELVTKNQSKIVMLIMDGLGGCQTQQNPKTELQSASKPELDGLARRSSLGLFVPVDIGITPGSGAGHLGLFGYDPVKDLIGRGMLSAVGIGFPVERGDVAVRGNFATMDSNRAITDRRAGRISSEECSKLCATLSAEIKECDGARIFFAPEKEHRFVMIIRGSGVGASVSDTDPQKVGMKILPAKGSDSASEKSAQIINKISSSIQKVFSSRQNANCALMRGVASLPSLQPFEHRYGVKPCCIGTYPMYRGLAKLLGMDVLQTAEEENLELLASVLRKNYSKYDFFFVHVKKTDSYGEDGNFDAKVGVIEKVSKFILPAIIDLNPDVTVICGDHSTPAPMKAHSFHPVPLLLNSRLCFIDDRPFDEVNCASGTLGIVVREKLMMLVLAHSGRLAKFGA